MEHPLIPRKVMLALNPIVIIGVIVLLNSKYVSSWLEYWLWKIRYSVAWSKLNTFVTWIISFMIHSHELLLPCVTHLWLESSLSRDTGLSNIFTEFKMDFRSYIDFLFAKSLYLTDTQIPMISLSIQYM